MDAAKNCSCSEVHISLHELLNEELSAADCARLREHVLRCPQCAAALAQETQLRELLQKSCSCKAPDTLQARIRYTLQVQRWSTDS